MYCSHELFSFLINNYNNNGDFGFEICLLFFASFSTTCLFYANHVLSSMIARPVIGVLRCAWYRNDLDIFFFGQFDWTPVSALADLF